MDKIFNVETGDYDEIDPREIKRVKFPDDPNRCQGIWRHGQCPHQAAVGSKYCRIHGGHSAHHRRKEEAMANYLLTKYQARLDQKTAAGEIKSLRDEIGLLRMMIEMKINNCHDEAELVIQASSISEMLVKVEKLVSSCHRIEASLGEHLDKSAVLALATSVIEIIGRLVPDAEIVEQISKEIINSLGTLIPETKDDETKEPES